MVELRSTKFFFAAHCRSRAKKTLLRSRRAKAPAAKQNISACDILMHYVYVLRSINHSKRLYIGCAEDLDKRLIEHNRGDSAYSKMFAPWELESYVAFKGRVTAEAFEHYLKSGSGHAFLKKRLLPNA